MILSLFKRQSKELTAFYRAYNEWLEVGAPDEYHYIDNPNGFIPELGLCNALKKFCTKNNISYKIKSLSIEMEFQFFKKGLSTIYPFGEKEYDTSVENTGTLCCHQPKRIQWVKDHLKPEFTGEKEVLNENS